MEITLDKKLLLNIKEELHEQADVQFCKEFLRLTNLKVGDIVEAKFRYHEVQMKDYRNRDCIAKGIIKEHTNSEKLYVESLEEYSFATPMSNNRSGRDYRSWYETRKRKAKSDLLDILLIGVESPEV